MHPQDHLLWRKYAQNERRWLLRPPLSIYIGLCGWDVWTYCFLTHFLEPVSLDMSHEKLLSHIAANNGLYLITNYGICNSVELWFCICLPALLFSLVFMWCFHLNWTCDANVWANLMKISVVYLLFCLPEKVMSKGFSVRNFRVWLQDYPLCTSIVCHFPSCTVNGNHQPNVLKHWSFAQKIQVSDGHGKLALWSLV